MHTLQLFINLVQEHRYWGYVFLFFAMVYEGELFLSATGMLVGLGAFDPFDSFFFAFSGVLAGDLFWYWLGRHLKDNHSHRPFINKAVSKVHKILPGLEKNPAHVIFFSKFIYGLNHTTILVLGYLKINFREFFKVQFLTSLVWSFIFWALGYLFGATAIHYAHSISRVLLIIAAAVIVLVLIERYVRAYIIKREHKK